MRIRNKYINICIALMVLVNVSAFKCGGNSQKEKDIRRDVASQIHRIENTLLRLTELRETLYKQDKIHQAANIKIARALIQINDIARAANGFLKTNKDINPDTKKEVISLLANGLTFVAELNGDANFILDEKLLEEFRILVGTIRAAMLTIQTILEVTE